MEHPTVADADAEPAGHGADRDTATAVDGTVPLPPPRRGPGMRPALLVVGIAAGVILLFGTLAAVTSGGSGGTVAPPARAVAVQGSTLTAVPAAGGLSAIAQPGTPPPDVLNALILPSGWHLVSSTPSTGAGQYNASARFTVTSPEATVIAFYKNGLRSRGWKVFSVGPAKGALGSTEVLAQKAGSDGWYWEVGAVVSPTTFATGTGQETAFTVTLFEVPDAA